MELCSAKKIASRDEVPQPVRGDVSDYLALLDHVFKGQPEARKDFERQMAFRHKHPEVKMPIVTFVPIETAGHKGCPCFKLLTDIMAVCGINIEVLFGVSERDADTWRARAGQ